MNLNEQEPQPLSPEYISAAVRRRRSPSQETLERRSVGLKKAWAAKKILKVSMVEDIRSLYRSGSSCYEIGLIYGVTGQTVNRFLNRIALEPLRVNPSGPRTIRFHTPCKECGNISHTHRQPKPFCSTKCKRRSTTDHHPLLKQQSLLEAGLRECTGCRTTQSIDAFWAVNSKPLSKCKLCAGEIQKVRRKVKPSPPSPNRFDLRKKWRDNNKEIYQARIADWRRRNPDYGARSAARRRFRKKSLGVFYLTDKDLRRLRIRQGHLCYLCGRTLPADAHMEHIIPLSRGGRHSIGNIMFACPACNHKKGTKLLSEFKYGKPSPLNYLCGKKQRASREAGNPLIAESGYSM